MYKLQSARQVVHFQDPSLFPLTLHNHNKSTNTYSLRCHALNHTPTAIAIDICFCQIFFNTSLLCYYFFPNLLRLNVYSTLGKWPRLQSTWSKRQKQCTWNGVTLVCQNWHPGEGGEQTWLELQSPLIP